MDDIRYPAGGRIRWQIRPDSGPNVWVSMYFMDIKARLSRNIFFRFTCKMHRWIQNDPRGCVCPLWGMVGSYHSGVLDPSKIHRGASADFPQNVSVGRNNESQMVRS